MTYRKAILSTATLLAAVGAVGQPEAQARPHGLDGHQVLTVTVHDESELATLLALDAAGRDFEIWSDGVGVGLLDVRVSLEQKRKLDAAGFVYEVQIDDLQRHYDELFGGAREGDFFSSYRTYDEHVAFMNDLATAYPDLVEVMSLGSSVQGRSLWAMRITGPGSEKPGVMYHGAQHGNETMGTAVLAYLAEYLVTHYDDDPTVQALVDNVEWFLLPIMNPDGYEEGFRHNANDVDLNRNWGGPGSQPFPFSQPETAAMRDFFLSHPNVRAHVDLHMSGFMILWPWGHTSELCVDNGTFEHLGDEMAERIYQLRGTDYDERGPTYTTIYPVFGGSVDYSYAEHGLWAFVYEVGYSQSMPAVEIIPTCGEIRPALMFLSAWMMDCNENGFPDSEDIASAFSEDCNENGTPDECELPDFDGDGLIDVCDPDMDDDGVPNEFDPCDTTPRGTPIDDVGRPLADRNFNCDVDLSDYLYLLRCINRSGPGIPAPAYCVYVQFDDNVDVDLADVAGFMRVFTGLR